MRLLELISAGLLATKWEGLNCSFLKSNHCPVIPYQVFILQLSQPALEQNTGACLEIQFRFIITTMITAHPSQFCLLPDFLEIAAHTLGFLFWKS